CRPRKKPGVKPKYRVKRRSVSAVTARLPSTISLIRRGGTRNARASAVWLRLSGRRNSSSRISPGVGLGSQYGSVIIDDFDMGRASIPPVETDAPLVVDANRISARPFTLQRLQSIAGRRA